MEGAMTLPATLQLKSGRSPGRSEEWPADYIGQSARAARSAAYTLDA